MSFSLFHLRTFFAINLLSLQKDQCENSLGDSIYQVIEFTGGKKTDKNS